MSSTNVAMWRWWEVPRQKGGGDSGTADSGIGMKSVMDVERGVGWLIYYYGDRRGREPFGDHVKPRANPNMAKKLPGHTLRPMAQSIHT